MAYGLPRTAVRANDLDGHLLVLIVNTRFLKLSETFSLFVLKVVSKRLVIELILVRRYQRPCHLIIAFKLVALRGIVSFLGFDVLSRVARHLEG